MSEVRLRPVEDDDLEALYEHQADPAWAPMVGMPARSRDEFLAHMDRVRADPRNLYRVIEADGVVVGSIGSFPVKDVREVGYSLGREHWGRGIASRALELMLAEDPHRPLSAGVAPHNAASRRVLEKAGFVPVGRADADGFDLYERA